MTHPLTFATTNENTTKQSYQVLFENLHHFVGLSSFRHNPALFEELFTKEAMYTVPCIPEADISKNVRLYGKPEHHSLHDEITLQILIDRYLFGIVEQVVKRAKEDAEASGDSATADVLRNRGWRIASEGQSRCDFVLSSPNLAGGEAKRHHVVANDCFDILVTIFRTSSISIEAPNARQTAVHIDWETVFEEHHWDPSDPRQHDRGDGTQPARWQENVRKSIQQTLVSLVQQRVDISILTTYQRWIVVRLTSGPDGSVVFELSPVVHDRGIMTPDEPWLHPIGLLICLAFLRPLQHPLAMTVPRDTATKRRIATVYERDQLNFTYQPAPHRSPPANGKYAGRTRGTSGN